MNLKGLKIMLVGAGAMGSALLKGWGLTEIGNRRVTIITPRESSFQSLREHFEVDWHKTPDSLAVDFSPDLIVLAVKPSVLETILKAYRRFSRPQTLFISVAAGKTSDFYASHLGSKLVFVRAMPNLPVAYQQGMTVIFADPNIEPSQLTLAKRLFEAVGKIAVIDNEGLFDAATAIAGCGPAYLYLLVESLTQAAIDAGIAQGLAEKLARQTLIGAGISLSHSTESAPILKNKVASPGGVTEAALKILDNKVNGFPALMRQAVKAATERSRELSNN